MVGEKDRKGLTARREVENTTQFRTVRIILSGFREEEHSELVFEDRKTYVGIYSLHSNWSERGSYRSILYVLRNTVCGNQSKLKSLQYLADGFYCFLRK